VPAPLRLSLILISLLALIQAKALQSVLQRYEVTSLSHPEEEPKYLPKLEFVRLATLGFDQFGSDIAWFYTINYFGRAYREKGDFRWLDHYCSLTTTLNPHSVERVEFCATLLSWMAKLPDKSSALLRAAIQNNPSDWRLRYLYSFNLWFFQSDIEGGANELKVAATLPEAPPGLAKLASRLLTSANDPQVAVDYLEEAVQRAQSEAARSALSIRLRQALLSRDLHRLSILVAQFKERFSRLPHELDELVAEQMIDEIPVEPFGGEYLLTSTGEIRTSSGKKGLQSGAIKSSKMKQEITAQ